MIGLVTNVWPTGDPRRPDGAPAPAVLYVTVPGDREHPDPIQQVTVDLVATYSGDPPPPMSVCRFTDDLTPHCLGPVDLHVEPVLREHFLYVPTVTADGLVQCDTAWEVDVNGAGSEVASAGGVGRGVVQLTAGATSGRYAWLRKSDGAYVAGAADAWWVRAKIVSINATTLVNASLGLLVNSLADSIQISYNTAAGHSTWNLITGKDLTETATPSTYAPALFTSWVVDLILVPGVYGALWIDGSLEAVSTTNVPDTGDTFQPYIFCGTSTAATRLLMVDYLWVDAITGPLAHPLTHELLTL